MTPAAWQASQNKGEVTMMDISESDRLGEIAETAKSVLETLLGLMGIDASVMSSDESPFGGEEEETPSILLDIMGEDLGILIGRRGQTLASLQYIVRLIVGQQTKMRLPIVIDVEGYRKRRWEALQALAWRVAEQVKLKMTPFTLEPMPAFERRIVHLTLADNPDVITQSAGEGEARRVVILPRGQTEQ